MTSVSKLEEEKARTSDPQVRQQLQELIDKRTKERKARREAIRKILFGVKKRKPIYLDLVLITGVIIIAAICGIAYLSSN